MFFIPLSQVESVELVIHALKAAAGEADCSSCPVRRVCMKQCLSIAEAVAGMVESGTLPSLDPAPATGGEGEEVPTQDQASSKGEKAPEKPGDKGHLKVIK